MSYHKVTYEKLFPYAPYLNERIGIELIVEQGQDPQEALAEAKRQVEQFYSKSTPVVQDEELPVIAREDNEAMMAFNETKVYIQHNAGSLKHAMDIAKEAGFGSNVKMKEYIMQKFI